MYHHFHLSPFTLNRVPPKKIEKIDRLPLIHDLLDEQLIDADGRRSGRIDGIILQLRPSRPPRLTYLEVGTSTLFSRLDPALGRLVQRLQRHIGPRVDVPWRIETRCIEEIGLEVKIGVRAARTSAFAWEDWLRDHILRHIPGSGL